MFSNVGKRVLAGSPNISTPSTNNSETGRDRHSRQGSAGDIFYLNHTPLPKSSKSLFSKDQLSQIGTPLRNRYDELDSQLSYSVGPKSLLLTPRPQKGKISIGMLEVTHLYREPIQQYEESGSPE